MEYAPLWPSWQTEGQTKTRRSRTLIAAARKIRAMSSPELELFKKKVRVRKCRARKPRRHRPRPALLC